MNIVEEQPTVDMHSTIATRIPSGMIESLKATRHEIALIHSQVIKDFDMVPAFLSGAYQALEDAENFLKNVANGKEELTPVPPKPVIKEDDKVADDFTIKVPSNLKDIPYMQEWSGSFFFPRLRELVARKDVEVDLRGETSKNKKNIQLALSVTLPNASIITMPTKYKANSVINLLDLAKSIDAL